MNKEDLRQAFANLAPSPLMPPPQATWPRYLWNIRRHVKNQDVDDFLTWSTIHATMFVSTMTYFLEVEMRSLEENWDRWKGPLTESNVGQPPRLEGQYEFTSGNLVHQAFHLQQFEKVTGRNIETLNQIVEFGGGYGLACAIVRRLGFEGDYIIYDNAEMSLLQQYYLSNLGYEATFRQTNGDAFEVPDRADNNLLIACYSLSEVTVELRSAFIDRTEFDYYLIVHQPSWHGIDLVGMFDGLPARIPDRHWKMLESPIRHHRYVIGMPHRE